jgi:ABC-type branched-subunit amino acid transport system ATPase component
MGEPRLRLDCVTVRFGGIVALDGVTLEVSPGEVLGIIGPNGAGKTTLFDVITGVRTPASGRVILDGKDITTTSAVSRARLGVRRTFQRVQTFGWLTVEDNVLCALDWHSGGGGFAADVLGLPGRRRRERNRRREVERVLQSCGLTDLRHELAGSLSIGAARSVEIARAVVDRPAALLLDEPVSGLDETEAMRLADQIDRLRSEGDCAVLLVEHNAGFVMARCDRVVVLDRGGVLAVGTPAQIQANDAVRNAYLGGMEVHPA